MGLKRSIFYIFVIVSIYGAYKIHEKFSDGPVPKINYNPYWGKGEPPKNVDTSVRPFKIQVEESVLKDLKERLKLESGQSRHTEPLEGIAFQYGFNTKFLKTFRDHWLNKYDWKKREAKLNVYPHFKTNIFGIDVHFQHIKGNSKKQGKTVPLLLCHGWPGSFVEFQKAIPLLMKSDVNFDLVIPSLPGYGFSEGAHKPGMGAAEMGQIFKKLMERLGYEKFYVQGGDWGSVVVADMAILYPESVKGIHLNMLYSQHPRSILRQILGQTFPSFFMTPAEIKRFVPFSKAFGFLLMETGYFHIQATKPDTVGVAIGHSPSGLLAYIMEKVPTSTNPTWLEKEDGGFLDYYDLDEWLDDVMVYWVSNSFTTAVRIYSEVFRKESVQYALNKAPVTVPTAYLHLPHEPVAQPFFVVLDKYPNIVRHNIIAGDKGGHFAAFEVPDVFVEDVVASIQLFEQINSKPSKQEL